MSYVGILAAVQAKLATLPGVVAVLAYAPTAVHDTPLIYLLFDGATLIRQGPVIQTTYRIGANLVVRWQDNERAEQEIIPFVDSIPALFREDPQLDGTLVSGMARVAEIESGDLVTIGGVDYRLIRFVIEVMVKE